jgi:hypothetical protein
MVALTVSCVNRFLNTRYYTIHRKLLNLFWFIHVYTTCDLSEPFPSVVPSCFSVFVFYSSVFLFAFCYLLFTPIRRLVRFLLAFITVNPPFYWRTGEFSDRNHMITVDHVMIFLSLGSFATFFNSSMLLDALLL